MSDESIADLLERLSSGRVGVAWREFLAQYSPVIMHVIRRHVADHDRAAECFVQVCSALSDDDFRKLRSFRPDGPARFSTWLMAVVANLCVDWRRHEQGRVRAPQGVSHLPELDQHVYRCIYLRRMSRTECVETLQPRFPGLTAATVSEINARLFRLLSPQQRWQASSRNHALHPVALGVALSDDDPASQVAAEEPGPADEAAEIQESQLLQEALARLPAEQRLLLRLRYEQDLTLAEVARLTGQHDPFRANRQIHAALETLGGMLGHPGARSPRKK